MFRKLIIVLALLDFALTSAYCSVFVPEQPTLSVDGLKPGMRGHLLTVMKGTEPSKIPVRVVSILPQVPGRSIHDLILVKLTSGAKLAQGMSGSPVYVNGKLIGAVRSGWTDSDHTLAMVTPIDSMCALKEYESLRASLPLASVSISGVSSTTRAVAELSKKLGVDVTQGAGIISGGLVAESKPFRPGDSVAVVLVWGDIELSAVGAVTATAKDGSFLAMGHDFLKRGTVGYPSAGAYIHEVVDSSSFPFKLASLTAMNGTITQDREAGIMGRTGHYAPSVSGEFVFVDTDRNTKTRCRFRTIADEFLTGSLIEGVCAGLSEELWGRNGQGTMSVNLRIDGKNIPKGWARKDIFFSDDDIIKASFKNITEIIDAYLTQPYSEALPAGFVITIEASEKPKVLMIEEVETVSEAKPGEEIEVSVKLRGWRSEPVTEKFKLKIPDDSAGVVELIVRGGGIQSFGQAGIEGGWKSVTSLERMLTEFKAADSNNQLIVELNTDKAASTLEKVLSQKKSASKQPDLLPEEKEYLSETKERRIKEGTLKIYSTEYVVDGLMRSIITVSSQKEG